MQTNKLLTEPSNQIAFGTYEKIMQLPEEERYAEWMMDYRGLHFAIAESAKEKIFWKQDAEKYVYTNAMPIQCLDGKYRLPNKIQRHKRRLVIEFDDKKLNTDGVEVKDKLAIRKHLHGVEEKLKSLGVGYIRSTHAGSSDYLWVEFTRDLTSQEAESFLKWIAPDGSEIDLNFSSDNKRFPVLFAPHWKYNVIETPIDYFKGNQIDYDSLPIKKINMKAKTITTSTGFRYKTAIKEFDENTELKFWTVQDYFNYKEPKNKYIIEKLAFPGEITMSYGRSGSMKSLHILYKAICLASGRKYLNTFKVKPQNVAILSAENPILTDKFRIRNLYRGLALRNRKIPLYILPRELCGDVLDNVFKERLFKFIDDKQITVLFMDTVNPLTPGLDDNAAKDVTRFFNELLKHLSARGVYVEFLHHTDKKARDVLGSMKWTASSDNVMRFDRRGLANYITITNEKNRNGETGTLRVCVEFTSTATKFTLLGEQEPFVSIETEKKLSKLDKQKGSILEILKKPTGRQQLIDALKEKEQFTSSATFDRAIKELVNVKIKSEEGVYSKI